MKQTLVLGGPGSGKTTRLLTIMEECLARGVAPAEIAFVTFSKAAAEEARQRAMERFSLASKALPYFRTIHSLCFHELGLRSADVMGPPQLRELADLIGEELSGREEGNAPALSTTGDALLFLEQYARTTRTTLDDAWRDHGAALDWYRLIRFVKSYTAFKEDLALLDFTDMLERYVHQAWPAVPVRVAIVDEAQDLTLLQWAVVHQAFAKAEELWIGGDDDQAVHRWAGAATEYLLSLPYERQVLPVSHRLPRQVFDIAAGVVGRIAHRYPKVWQPAAHTGAVEWLGRPDELELGAGTWLLLGRTRRMLEQLEATARHRGVTYSIRGRSAVVAWHVQAIQLYERLRAGRGAVGPEEARVVCKAMGRTPAADLAEDATWDATALGIDTAPIWHDALVGIPLDDREYYLACLRRGEKLHQPPRVRIETIHGSKGAEADYVLLLTDMSYHTHRGFELDPDSEHRVFYVGLTRAKVGLYIVPPQTQYGYRL